MKPIILLLTILSFSLQASAQTLPSSCWGPEQLYKTYYTDIKELAIQYINENKLVDTQFVNPPQRYLDTIAAGLYAIYNTGTVFGADSIFRKYCIHNDEAFEAFTGTSIDVHIYDAEWLKNWEKGQIQTGYVQVDEVLKPYNFRVEWCSQNSYGYVARLYSDSTLNVKALCDSMLQVEDIYYCFETTRGIIMEQDYKGMSFARDTASYISFSIAWGGSGQYSQTWGYRVNNDCMVTFLGTQKRTYDKPLLYATPEYCNLFPVAVPEVEVKKEIEIYPNPASDYVKVSGSFDGSKYVVRGITGQVLLRGNCNGELDISALPAGIYLLQIMNRETSFTGRFSVE